MQDLTITTGHLSNGLRYVIDETDIGKAVSVVAIVKAGSIFEYGHLGAGLSHFCEHIIHEGTTSEQTNKEYTKLVEKLGNNSNAYTTKDHTLYYITTTADLWEEALQCILEWVFDCQFIEDEFNREKGVILREIEKSGSEPNKVLSRLFYETMFTVHPVRYPVLGYKEVFSRVTRDMLYSYYKKVYIPQNVIIAVSGNINTEYVKGKIREQGEQYEVKAGIDLADITEPNQLGMRERIELREMGGGYMQMGFHTVSLDHKDLFPLDVLSAILSEGDTGRLVYSIKEKQALAFSIGTYSYTPMYDAGVFGVWSFSGPANLMKINTEIWNIFDDIKRNGVTDLELKKAKKQMESDHIRGLKTVEDRARSFGLNYFFTSDPFFDVYYINNIKKVTAEEIMEVSNKYLKKKNATVTYLAPHAIKPSEIKGTGKKDETVTQKTLLSNGVILLARKCGSLPLINIEISARGGTRVENSKNAGISSIFSKMLLRGSKHYTRDEIISYFDTIGGSIASASGRNTFGIRTEILSEDFERTIDLIADVLTNPVFPEDELEKVKQLTIQALQSENDNWNVELANKFREEFFQKHPYRNNIKGTIETVSAITKKDLESFYSENIVGDNMVIGIYGNIDPGHVVETVKEKFAGINRGTYQSPDPPQESPLKKSRKKILKSQNKGVAGIYIGYPGIRYTETEHVRVLEVIDAMTSGVGYPAGWLHETLRGNQLVYVVHAFNVHGMDPGYFGIYAGCDPNKVDKAVELIFSQMDRLQEGAFSDEEVNAAKNLCIISETLQNQTPGDFAVREVLDTVYGLGHDFYEDYEEQIARVTRDKIIEAAHIYFNNYVMVITEPASGNR